MAPTWYHVPSWHPPSPLSSARVVPLGTTSVAITVDPPIHPGPPSTFGKGSKSHMAIILSETWTHGLLLMPSLHVSQDRHSHLIRLCATAECRPLGQFWHHEAPDGSQIRPRWIMWVV